MLGDPSQLLAQLDPSDRAQPLHALVDWCHDQAVARKGEHAAPSHSGPDAWRVRLRQVLVEQPLVSALPAVRVRSDVERKRLAGLDVSASPSTLVIQEIHSAQFSHRTYARLADCAQRCLRAGLDVIVDAAFLDVTDREAFQRLAQQLRTGFAIVSCQADPITLASRILQRGREHADPSNATLAVLDLQLRNFQPFSAGEQQYVIAVDTGQDNAVAQVSDAITARGRASQ